MALWKADIKVVDTGTFFTVTVDAGSAGTAKETIQHIYNPLQIYNLRQVSSRGNSSASFSSGDTMAGAWILFGLILLGLVVKYWYIALPLAVICILLYLYSK